MPINPQTMKQTDILKTIICQRHKKQLTQVKKEISPLFSISFDVFSLREGVELKSR